jgi:hypothetical protein
MTECVHCSKEREIDETHKNTITIIQALYGKAGELNGEGVGLVARSKAHDDRLTVIEDDIRQVRKEQKEAQQARSNRAWDATKIAIPYAVAALAMAIMWWHSTNLHGPLPATQQQATQQQAESQ